MQIDAMTLSDYDEIISLWKNTSGMGISQADDRDGIERFLLHNPGLSFVCTELDRIIGTILCGFDGRRGYIYHLAVDQAYRGRGIGKMLANKGLAALKAIGAEKCHLFVLKNNDLGQAFWHETGWTLRNDIVVFSKDI